MKKCITLILIILVFLFALHKHKELKTKETFNVNVKTTEGITGELIVAFLIEDIDDDINSFYKELYSDEISVYNYEVAVLKVAKEDANKITVKVGVTPQVGAHNPLGYDELTYKVDARGDSTLEDYVHVKSYY